MDMRKATIALHFQKKQEKWSHIINMMDIFEGGRNNVGNHSTSLSSAPKYDFGVQNFGSYGNFGNFGAGNFGNCSNSIFLSHQFRAAAEKIRDEVECVHVKALFSSILN